METINWWAVIVAGVAQWLIGWVWYGHLFKKQWLALSGINQDPAKMKEGMPKAMIGGLTSGIVMGAVLAMILRVIPVDQLTTSYVVILAAVLWLGFIATTMINSFLYEQKPFTLFAINSSYYLVSLIVMGLILAAWR